MIALSKEEFKELDNELEQNEKTILEYLAEVHHKNPQNPWVDIKTLGAQIGGFTGEVEAGIAALSLLSLDLISHRYSRHERIAAISEKGLAYVNFNKRQYIVSHKRPSRKLLWGIIIPLIVTIVGGVIVALIMGWRPW
jgi:hypothetical protein